LRQVEHDFTSRAQGSKTNINHQEFSYLLQAMLKAGVVKIAMYTDGILIQFLFHILRFQVSGIRNDEQRR
jgi:hypothetical protein